MSTDLHFVVVQMSNAFTPSRFDRGRSDGTGILYSQIGVYNDFG